jgi:hypothetical protein
VLPGAVVPLTDAGWYRPIPPTAKLPAGAVVPDLIRVPVRDANTVLLSIIHLVADIRADASPTVVWTLGAHELLVHLDRTQLVCAPGFVTLAFFVECDQVRSAQRVDVLMAVGSKARPGGLVMSTFDRVQGPLVITDTWSAPIIAFAWETLVTTTQQLTAGLGRDARKRALVPFSIAADTDVLLIGAMARHDLRLADEK